MTQAFVPISVALTEYLPDILPVYTLFIGGGIMALVLTLYIAKLPAMHKLDYTKENISKQVNLSTNTLDA